MTGDYYHDRARDPRKKPQRLIEHGERSEVHTAAARPGDPFSNTIESSDAVLNQSRIKEVSNRN